MALHEAGPEVVLAPEGDQPATETSIRVATCGPERVRAHLAGRHPGEAVRPVQPPPVHARAPGVSRAGDPSRVFAALEVVRHLNVARRRDREVAPLLVEADAQLGCDRVAVAVRERAGVPGHLVSPVAGRDP